MSIEFKKLSDVKNIQTMKNSLNVLVDDGGEIVKIAAPKITYDAFETVTTNTIEWDGVIGDRVMVTVEGQSGYMVHVSDYVPDMEALDQQKIDGVLLSAGMSVDFNTNFIKVGEGVYILGFNNAPVVTAALFDGAKTTFNSAEVVLPKAGVYFMYAEVDGIVVYVPSISSPLLAVPTVKVKPEALPDNVPGSYVVRLPADTPLEMVTHTSGIVELRLTAGESYDNFAEILYRGGRVMIDSSAIDIGTGSSLSVLIPTVWNAVGGTLYAATPGSDMSGNLVMYAIHFPNGTWQPPTA